jgi:hypothetical protein
MAAAAAALAIIYGTAHTIQFGAVTVTFPSDKFCKSYMDQDGLNKVQTVAANQSRFYAGNGFIVACGMANCGHVHVTGSEGLAFKWDDDTHLKIVAYGTKGGKGASKASGSYTWVDK